MKHMRTIETFSTFVISVLICYLVFAPILFDISAGQSVDDTPPILSHHTIKMARRGKPLNITAFVADDSKIKEVTITINYAGKSRQGNMPKRKGMDAVPVVVEAIKDLKIYSKNTDRSTVRGTVTNGEQLDVTRIRGEFYRVTTHEGLSGYVKAKDTKIIKLGSAYGVALPPSVTTESTIFYQITVTDVFGNTTMSDLNQVKLLTTDEVKALLAQRRSTARTAATASSQQPKHKEKKRSFAAIWILAGLAAIGGGIYYFLNQKEETSDNATVDVLVEWQ